MLVVHSIIVFTAIKVLKTLLESNQLKEIDRLTKKLEKKYDLKFMSDDDDD